MDYVPFITVQQKFDNPLLNTSVKQPSVRIVLNNVTSDLTSFLLKKDLLFTRLSVFYEKPEHYPSWKANVQSIMRELNATPSEEMDLLIRWLGKDSGRHAVTIRSSLSTDPRWGVKKIWERLDKGLVRLR